MSIESICPVKPCRPLTSELQNDDSEFKGQHTYRLALVCCDCNAIKFFTEQTFNVIGEDTQPLVFKPVEIKKPDSTGLNESTDIDINLEPKVIKALLPLKEKWKVIALQLEVRHSAIYQASMEKEPEGRMHHVIHDWGTHSPSHPFKTLYDAVSEVDHPSVPSVLTKLIELSNGRKPQ